MIEVRPDVDLPRRPPSQRQEALLEELEAIAQAEPFGALTVGELAARLSCSRATLYALAPSKEQLFLRIVDRVLRRIEQTASRDAAHVDRPTERLNAYLASVLAGIRKVGAPLVAEIRANAATRQRLSAFQRSVVDEIRALVERGIETGDFEAVNPVLVAELIDAAASRLQDPRVLAHAGLGASDALEQFFQVVTRGLVK